MRNMTRRMCLTASVIAAFFKSVLRPQQAKAAAPGPSRPERMPAGVFLALLLLLTSFLAAEIRSNQAKSGGRGTGGTSPSGGSSQAAGGAGGGRGGGAGAAAAPLKSRDAPSLVAGAEPGGRAASNAISAAQWQAGFLWAQADRLPAGAFPAAPEGAAPPANWAGYGVSERVTLLPETGWPFSFGTGAVGRVYATSFGALLFDYGVSSPVPPAGGVPDGTGLDFAAPLQTVMGVTPPDGSFRYASGADSATFTWGGVHLGRDTNCTATVQAEFYAGGDFTFRYHFPGPAEDYARLTNAFLIGAQCGPGGETVLRTNTLAAIDPGLLPAFELRWKSLAGLDPAEADHDGDGLSTADEFYKYRTDPRSPDTDGDGLLDGEEVFTFGTDPNAFSSDGGGTGDLWRVIGGLLPSDAPRTNAAPSDSVGVLTVTTLLEGGAADGGAVLRIADAYIPVLPGTTLVSRIAVPRDATNLFILARGAGCDNAVAHVTLEASSFTKLRDPSGVFAGGFTLSPSRATASGTLVMPAYTLTPPLVCFHSPTASVIRVVSADPDVLLSTQQGLVREYAPQPPDIPPGTFSNGFIRVRLASADATLATLAAAADIPAHFCNPGGGPGDEYPGGPSFKDWCRFENGEHVWAEGHGPADCPCLVFTNAFECPCSGDGRHPCECAHPVRDPKAMPRDGSPTNVTGHAALVIGGTDDPVEVTVPEGTWRPCPLCGCATEVPSSASVFRQTSCIEVTPSALTADGAFSVAGVSPSTNFADTVFMYCVTDYSGAQAVTSYTRKDYTVLGTSVYPSAQGHSVSNWFVRCWTTNELTLKTDVRLPAGTVTVALTGTARLDLYNRAAMTNDLILSPDISLFSMGINEWRAAYCDTNGCVQAYLYAGGTEPDSGLVTFGFEAQYEGGSVSCSSGQAFIPYMVTFEPVTAENAPDVYNPSGVAAGGTAWYTITVEPASRFPGNAITWCAAYGDVTFVNGNNKGRLAGIQAGGTTNDFRLDVTVDGLDLDPAPNIITHVLEPKTVPVKAWVVRDPIMGVSAATPTSITNMIETANRYLSQMAMTLVLNGPICVTNRAEWMEIEYVNGAYPEANELRAIEHGTGGIELYFVGRIGDDAATVGLNGPGGTLIASNATGRTLAHEVGHACGLEDVYVSRPNETSLYLDGLATEARMPGDWGGGFYPKGASQAEVIMRLLMYGDQESSFDQGDVTSGKVYGLGYRWAGSSKVWSLDKFKTGFDGMTTRQPEHL